jgi:hypothetical protein
MRAVLFQHQCSTPSLDEMTVDNQGIANAEFLHRYERRAIDKTPRLVHGGMILVPPIAQGDHVARIDKQPVNLVDDARLLTATRSQIRSARGVELQL